MGLPASSRGGGAVATTRACTTVDVNPVAQNATVTYDPAVTSVVELTAWVRDCGYHCAGQSVPAHVCDPMAEPQRTQQHHRAMQGTTSTQDTRRLWR